MLKSEICAEIEDRIGVGKVLVSNVLSELAEIAAEEVQAGNDFTVPGICKVWWSYTPPQKKGEKYKKDEEYVGFGGEVKVAEKDSPAKKASVRLRATPAAPTSRANPPVKERSAFLKTKTGRAIAARKG